MTFEFELADVTPNYYEIQICLACLDAAIQSMSVTVLIYRTVVGFSNTVRRYLALTEVHLPV
jgi:uncharacterized protein (DUF2225 family)